MKRNDWFTWAFRIRICRVAATLSIALFVLLPATEARAENLIRHPGAHPQYAFEIEPHLYFRYGRDDGAGPGVRASIPFMHNGPIDTINNNIGITFGADLPFYRGGALLDVPVAFQWNFYFTDIISVAGEAGFVSSFWTGPGGGFDLDPLFQGAGRFQFGKAGLLIRVGYPGVSIGANFQF